ncbi:MAG TPA: hypothetical protein P5234_04660 [Thermoanaerobaculaceae bacterium]|nr:hypothetical protein [Thermoanaerobaculaceae bacterium]HRS15523.1 hypothetical protein [Thermoanaerobaculaceae bacterium]
MLLATADDYLLELHRTDLEAEWCRQHPEGEVVALASASPVGRLVQEIQSPSLFAPTRLVVARDISNLFSNEGKAEQEELAAALDHMRIVNVWLVLAAEVSSPPAGPLAESVRRLGEVRHLPLPEPPKPWDPPGLSPPQRQVLRDLLERVLPDLRLPPETLDALCEAYGFKPRELVQAASRLALGGELTPEAVRVQAGPGECSPRDIEDLLIARDARGVARLLARLNGGAALVNWQGEPLDPGEAGLFLARMLGRLLKQVLALRCLAEESGLRNELEPSRCADKFWYPRRFKPSLLPPLQAAIATDPHSALAKASPWQLHRLFRLAAAYSAAELLAALGAMMAAGIERERRLAWRMAAITSVLLTLTGPPKAARKAAAG